MSDKIYCKKKLNKRTKKAFLIDYFENRCPSTYDSETNEVQCAARRNRSVGDLKMLLDGTFKTKTKTDDVIYKLVSLTDNSGGIVRALFCSDINRVVFYSSLVHPAYWELNIRSSFSTVGGDGYSWNELVMIYKNKTK